MTLSLISKSWKIVYAQIEEDSRARGFSTVFAWLKEAATVNLCTLVTDPHLELALNKFKAKFGTRVGTEYVLSTKPLKIEGDRVFLPLYMSICL